MDVTPNSQAPEGAASAVDMISALMDAERVSPDAKPEKKEAVAAANPEGEPDAEPSQNAQVEGEDAQDEGEQQPMAEIPLEQLEAISLEIKTKDANGNEVVEKPTIKELRDSFFRLQDYKSKTAEVARNREKWAEESRQAIDSERAAIQETVKQLQQLVIESVAPELKTVDWNALATNDPFEYVRLRNRAEQIQNTLNTIKSKETELTTKQKADQSQVLQKKVQATWQTLEADIPGFNKELYQSLLKTGIESGVAAETVTNWVDAGEIKLLHKAYLYDQLKAGKPAEAKKVVVAPTAIKPGSANVVPRQAQRQNKALETLRKTGSRDALADVIASMG